MLNIEKYKDEILNEYQQRMNNNTSNYSDGTRMNKAIKTIAYKHCGKLLHGASSPFKWLCEEYKEPPILDEVEKEYLRAVIKPFRNRIRCICLDPRSFDYYQIRIVLTPISQERYTEVLIMPTFKKDTMYKRMKFFRLIYNRVVVD